MKLKAIRNGTFTQKNGILSQYNGLCTLITLLNLEIKNIRFIRKMGAYDHMLLVGIPSNS
jgi:hypothetical protein